MSSDRRENTGRFGARPSSINRRLGPTENIYHRLNGLYCLNFAVFAPITGTLDLDRLALALQAVQAEHPLLRARVALVNGRYWFKPVPLEQHPLEFEAGPLRNWRLRVAEQLDKPFGDEAPLARFLLFRGSGRQCAAAMVFHHAIADGRSGADVFIEALRRAGGEDMPLRCRRARPSAQELDLVKLAGPIRGAIKTLGYWLNQGKNALMFAQQLPGYDMTVRGARNIRVIPFSVPKSTTKALLAACRAHGTTVHGALGAAQLLAINGEFQFKAARSLALNSLVDLRAALSGGLTQQDLGLYIATLTTVHGVATKPDFWALAADIRSQLKAVLDSGDANLVHTVYRDDAMFPPNQVGARMVQAVVALAPPSSMLTNIGRFDSIVLGNGASVQSLEFMVSPPAQHPICVTAASYADALHFNLLYDRRKMGTTQAARIVKSLAGIVARAAKA
jgi:NRPS condensation-like uncharacterized protein